MYVVSYFHIDAFHPSLNLQKIVIFTSFQQTEDRIYDISHFNQEHLTFFDRTIFFQLKDAAAAVLASVKATSLAELFSIELKFTIDTLSNWFSNRIKPKFLELIDVKRQDFIEKNKLLPETTCCICRFLVDVNMSDLKNVWICGWTRTALPEKYLYN